MDITLKQLHDYASTHATTTFNIMDGEDWLAAQCATSLVGEKVKMDGYFDFLYRDHTIPHKYGQLSKYLAERSNKYGGRVELTGEELAEQIVSLLVRESAWIGQEAYILSYSVILLGW